jgi:hypothetical protein
MNLLFEVWFSQCDRKHDRSQVVVYQLLCIWIKCSNISLYIFINTHSSSNKHISRGLESYKGTCCKTKVFV